MECLETGVYRSDIKYKFKMVPAALQGLIDKVERDLTFAIEVEAKAKVRTIYRYIYRYIYVFCIEILYTYLYMFVSNAEYVIHVLT